MSRAMVRGVGGKVFDFFASKESTDRDGTLLLALVKGRPA